MKGIPAHMTGAPGTKPPLYRTRLLFARLAVLLQKENAMPSLQLVRNHMSPATLHAPPAEEAVAASNSRQVTSSPGHAAVPDATSRIRLFARGAERRIRRELEKNVASTLIGAVSGLALISSSEAITDALHRIGAGEPPKNNDPLRRMTTGLRGLAHNLPLLNPALLEQYPELRAICDEAKRLLDEEILGPEIRLCDLGDTTGYKAKFSEHDLLIVKWLLVKVELLSKRASDMLPNLLERNPTWIFLDAETDWTNEGKKLRALEGKKGWDAIITTGQYGSWRQLRSEVARQVKKKFAKDSGIDAPATDERPGRRPAVQAFVSPVKESTQDAAAWGEEVRRKIAGVTASNTVASDIQGGKST